ncbi:hypothetical protein BVC80_1667g10 [Macleaya cordata]|uniref:Uncharacterized protein n=1 Tax=Macleaya cordata TaxID=56857 RepID=A0A200RBA6_MACCD|nr:hypothetical protein BVC80_1667g10 [Macleaya cordata]
MRDERRDEEEEQRMKREANRVDQLALEFVHKKFVVVAVDFVGEVGDFRN